MRILLSMLTASLLLAGCGAAALFQSSPQLYSAPGPCGEVARQRLEDARIIGFADGYEREIFDHANRSCLAQEANQPLPPR